MTPSQVNFFKLVASLGGVALGGYLNPEGWATSGKLLHKLLEGVAPNFVHQFLGAYDPVDIIKKISGPDELNHDIERLMIASVPKAFDEVRKKFQSEYEYDKEYLEIFQRLGQDAADKPMDQRDILTMVADRQSWLDDIADYVDTVADWDKTDTKLIFVQSYLNEHLLSAFTLVFTEGLKDPADEKPLKAFLIKSLEAVTRQLAEGSGLQKAILKEVQSLRADQLGNLLPAARQYLEVLNEKMDRAVQGIDQANDTLDHLKNETKNIRQELQRIRVQPRRSKYLNSFPQYDLANLVGREEQLNAMTKHLEQHQLILLHGIGGIGKTTLAKAFISIYQDQYDHIAFVEIIGSIRESFISQLSTSPDVGLAVDPTASSEVKFKSLIEILRHIPNLLLVLDNADDTDDLLQCKPQLASLNAKVLITGRAKPRLFVHERLVQEIGALMADEAMQLFENFYTPALSLEERLIVADMLKATFYHPKLVEVVAKAAEANAFLSLRDLVAIVERKDYYDDKINYPVDIDSQTKKIYSVLLDLFDTDKLSVDAEQMLRYFSVLPSMDIPVQDLCEFLQISDAAAQQIFQNLLNELAEAGWLDKFSNRFFCMHGLVQWVVQQRLLPNALNCKPLIIGIASSIALGESEHPLIKQRYLPYVTEWLKLFDHNLDDDLAKTFRAIADIYRALGNNKQRLALNYRALEIKKELFPSDHPELAHFYNNVAATYQSLGDFKKALSYNEKALEIRREKLASHDPALATTYDNMASNLGSLGDYKNELVYRRKALEIRESVIPANQNDLAFSYSNIAHSYGKIYNYDQELSFNLKALAIRKVELSPDHPDLAQSYNNLANTYRHINDLPPSLHYNQLSLTIRKDKLPPDHPDLAQSYSSLGATYRAMKNSEKCLTCYQRALEIRQTVLHSVHPDLAQSYNNLGVIYSDLKKHEIALVHLKKAEEIRRAVLGPHHRDLANTCANLAITYLNLGNLKDSFTYNQMAKRIYELDSSRLNPRLLEILKIEKLIKQKQKQSRLRH